jgi:tetratricopeptide (TPR) repeat protein
MNRGRTYFHWSGDGDRMLRTIDEIPAAIRDEAYWGVRAMVHYWVGDYAGALEANSRESTVNSFRIRVFQAAEIREAMGDLAGARRDYAAALPIAQQLCQQYPKVRMPQAMLALTYAGLGRKDDAVAAARKNVEAKGTSGANGDPHLSSQAVLAQVLARFGQMDEALEIMKTLAANHAVTRYHLSRSPEWRHLREDPRFQAIAEGASL